MTGTLYKKNNDKMKKKFLELNTNLIGEKNKSGKNEKIEIIMPVLLDTLKITTSPTIYNIRKKVIALFSNFSFGRIIKNGNKAKFREKYDAIIVPTITIFSLPNVNISISLSTPNPCEKIDNILEINGINENKMIRKLTIAILFSFDEYLKVRCLPKI